MNSIENILSREVQNGKTPSVQYIFFNKDRVLYSYQAGYANLKDRLKVDGNTTFQAYSVTKTFTALGILQLAEKGLVDLDKPAAHYLPAGPVVSRDITVRQLLTHTAGLANPLPISWVHWAVEHDSFDRDNFFTPILARQKLKSKPGSKFRYSNLGYFILGQLIEAVSGVPYEQYITENILENLALDPGELSFTIPHSALHAKGYHNKHSISMLLLGFMLDKKKYMGPATGKWKPFVENYVNGAAYGGLIGTASGFVKYGQALLGDQENLLSKPSKLLLFTENKLANGKASGMCMAWFTGQLNGRDYIMHAGGGGGYYCELRLYPELNAGSFVVFNRSGFSNEKFLDKLDVAFLK